MDVDEWVGVLVLAVVRCALEQVCRSQIYLCRDARKLEPSTRSRLLKSWSGHVSYCDELWHWHRYQWCENIVVIVDAVLVAVPGLATIVTSSIVFVAMTKLKSFCRGSHRKMP